MPLILSIETSTKVCSVALHKDSVLLACSEILIEKSHSTYITILIDNIVKQSGEALKNIDAVAVSKGPGSYTGLRIGASTAKGLCYALDKPLIAVNTLEAMAYEVSRYSKDDSLLCPMIDARRMEVYFTLIDSTGIIMEPTQAKVIDEHSFSELLKEKKVIFFGDGAGKCKDVLKGNAFFVNDVFPSAKNIGALALSKFDKSQFEEVAYFEPFYLKDFVRFGQ